MRIVSHYWNIVIIVQLVSYYEKLHLKYKRIPR